MILSSESVLLTLSLCAHVGIISGAGITELFCGAGQFINTATRTCETCPAGHYMSDHKHQNVDCKPCSEASLHRHEVVDESCSPLADAVIRCDEGYHKRALTSFKTHQEFDCYVCSDCGKQQKHEVRSCDRLYDAVCCPHPDMTAVWTDPVGNVSLPEQTII